MTSLAISTVVSLLIMFLCLLENIILSSDWGEICERNRTLELLGTRSGLALEGGKAEIQRRSDWRHYIHCLVLLHCLWEVMSKLCVRASFSLSLSRVLMINAVGKSPSMTCSRNFLLMSFRTPGTTVLEIAFLGEPRNLRNSLIRHRYNWRTRSLMGNEKHDYRPHGVHLLGR